MLLRHRPESVLRSVLPRSPAVSPTGAKARVSGGPNSGNTSLALSSWVFIRLYLATTADGRLRSTDQLPEPPAPPAALAFAGAVEVEPAPLLNAAVAAAYGWPDKLDDAAILERLLALNLERAAAERQDV